MKCDELTPIDLECNFGKDINGVEHREPWKAYDIDEVKAAIAELKSEADAYIRKLKYKRCLDKAAMCEARYDEEDAKVNGSGVSWEYISKEMKYWERWRWRWDALAEKFKEAK